MQTKEWGVKPFGVIVPAVTLSLLLVTGCAKNSNNPVSATGSGQATATEDAADVVAGAVGSNSGGALDQASDVMQASAGAGSFGTTGITEGNAVAFSDTVEKTYNPSDTSWSIYIHRERGSANGLVYGTWSRNYWVQFLDSLDVPQPLRYYNGHAAAAIHWKTLSGTGYFHNPRVAHVLDSLSSNWLATGTNTDTVTLNGTMRRVASDTIKTHNMLRVSTHTLQVTFVDVKGPRGSRFDPALKYSGTITVVYTGTVTFIRGTAYAEHNVNRTFTINLGTSEMTSNDGKVFSIDLANGEVLQELN